LTVGAEVPLPDDFVKALCELRFPAKTDERLQRLMDRNTEGLLSGDERSELESLVELGETMSLIRARALKSLGRTP
jgi:hypothetical protein